MTPEKQEFLKKELDMLMNKGLIRESFSPWAYSPLIVPKKGPKKWHFYVDYRPVNKVTKKDAYPLPRIKVSKKSGPVRKKVSIKKPSKLSDDEKSTELQNIMELIDIKGIV